MGFVSAEDKTGGVPIQLSSDTIRSGPIKRSRSVSLSNCNLISHQMAIHSKIFDNSLSSSFIELFIGGNTTPAAAVATTAREILDLIYSVPGPIKSVN